MVRCRPVPYPSLIGTIDKTLGGYTISEHLDQVAKDCISACNDCATVCGQCFAHMSGTASPNACPACCIECTALCRLCSDAIARHGPFAKPLCKRCADICDWCAKECDAHDTAHCKSCAEACRTMAA